ncbi:MAG: AmmeMemoRadiSam system protein B [Acidiferrobacterales bacterium]|nr:AmmeMemoRadiSam system protein B [Acidiferrobacterales bacterium]
MEQSVKISKTLRPAAVAGQFFSAVADELSQSVDQFLREAMARTPGSVDQMPKALVVPHAGYRFSGSIAASAYACVLPNAQRISRVVLLGPSHKVRMQGLGFSGADFFETPLGRIPVDVHTVRQCVSRFRFAGINNKAHQYEHSLETQLPFLQKAIGTFSLVPAVVGSTDLDQVAECLSFLWGGEETLILISTDLSHFKAYDDATEIDAITSRAILNLNPNPITYEHACGQVGLRGLLSLSQKKKLKAVQLDVRNSGDTAQRKDQVVGYGSFAFLEPVNRVNHAQRKELGQIARASIAAGLKSGQPMDVQRREYSDAILDSPGASFVTLQTTEGKLRGCLGSLNSQQPLCVNVSHNAFKSAFQDARFKPLTADEFQQIQIEISVLSPWSEVTGNSEEEIVSQLHPFVDGVIFISGNQRGTFLPAVWSKIPDPTVFFRQLKRKAGYAEDYWKQDVKVFRYKTETWRC